jgi:hypothetical protein
MAGTQSLVPYFPPVNPALFPMLYVVLLATGLTLMAYFFTYDHSLSYVSDDVYRYEATTPLSKKNLALELSVASVSSVCMGFGTLFLFLWGGLWL